MSQLDLETLERLLEHCFHDRCLLERAVTHSSLAFERNLQREAGTAKESDSSDAQPQHSLDNEKLEFLGDAVLGLLVAHSLYVSYPELEEGALTRLRATLVSRSHLGRVAQSMQLGDYLRLGRGEERSGGRQKSVLLANAFEALVAALYLDAGLEVARAFVERTVMEPSAHHLYRGLERGDNMGDHKSTLQELLQARGITPPEYAVMGESGPDHRKRFLVQVVIPGTASLPPITAQGTGTTKKRAEQEAAREACLQLEKQLPPPAALKSATV
jgi:ribonuclease III